MAELKKFDLDERMTEETVCYITDLLSRMRPVESLGLGLNLLREMRIQYELKANESLHFNNIEETQFNVKNKDDQYEISVTCYRPLNCRPNSPITIFFHGGGWSFYNVLSYGALVKSLASSTSTVWLSVEYRLSPEYKFPVGLNDCKYVLDYVYNNKSDFSSSDAKIGLSGDSSGGHYAALLANEFNSMLDYQILIYPGLDLSKEYDSQKTMTKDCYLLVPELGKHYLENLIDENSLELMKTEKLSPILFENLGLLPKTLIIAAELDPIVDQSREYFGKLQQLGVESELYIISGVLHGFLSYPVLMKKAFEEALSYVVQFMKYL